MEILNTLLVTVITTCVPILVTYAVKFLVTKRNAELQKMDDGFVKNTIVDVTDVILASVDSVSQTYVNDLKKEGKFTVQNQQEALDKAVESVKKLVTVDAADIINEKYGDFEEWVKVQIESYINSLK